MSAREVWEALGETIIRIIFKLRTGGATERRDLRETESRF